jgi:hypothetical protein
MPEYVIYNHPIEANTCEFCEAIASLYDGMAIEVGSDDYYALGEPFHPNCPGGFDEAQFELIEPSRVESGEVEVAHDVLSGIPVDSKIWENAYKSLWPPAVFAYMITREKEKPIKETDLTFADREYSIEEVIAAKKYIRELINKNDKDYRNKAILKYGINASIALMEMGL